MRRIRMTVSYDGTEYHGWQVQPGLATIQRTLEAVLSEIEGAPVPQLQAQRDGCGPSELRDQPFKAVFEEHVVLPGRSNIIASQAGH